MNIGDIFKEFKLDTWYKLFILAGIALFGFALFGEVKVFTNSQLALLAGSMFFSGLSRWVGDQVETRIIPPNVYLGGVAWKGTSHYWVPNGLAILFAIICLGCLIGLGNSILNPPVAASPVSTPVIIPTSTDSPTPSLTLTP